jgi:hypothetical protein
LLSVTDGKLDITQLDERQLISPLRNVDRSRPGFEDFCPGVVPSGIFAGKPARSLLYHALANPHVVLMRGGKPVLDSAAYPTLEELDAIENLIYALARMRLDDLNDPLIAVFAYQYRPGFRSTHRMHADMAFSRTGVARVGTTSPQYDAARRSFWPVGSNGGLRVMPARYGVFLAEARPPSVKDSVLDGRASVDPDLEFLFPVHKLFPGNECLAGESIESIDLRERHINQKLRRIHTRASDNPGFIPPISIFNLDAYPFTRDSIAVDDPFVKIERTGASFLCTPIENSRLVRTAKQRVNGRNEYARFVVPKARSNNRYETSLMIRPGNRGRAAPEYVNIRHEVTTDARGEQKICDLAKLDDAAFEKRLNDGGYEAVHFIDDTCEGALRADVQGLSLPIGDRAAYSLITAPDFLPLVDQVDIKRWVQRSVVTLPRGSTPVNSGSDHFRSGSPDPLSDGRLSREGGPSGVTPNPGLRNPGELEIVPAFPRDDRLSFTVTAVVGSGPLTARLLAKRARNRSASFLPDAASDVFAPGWDVSLHGNASGRFYTHYGLGSPFPEDAKLCAALNSFWPSAAPDASRVFKVDWSPTALPMLDSEVGFHPNHPRVKAGEVTASRGWDGEQGPFFEIVDRTLVVNYARIDRSDYVTNTLQKRLVITQAMAEVDSDEMIARMEALRDCVRLLDPTRRVSTTRLWLVTADRIENWAQHPDRGDACLAGSGYLYEFALASGRSVPVPKEVSRQRVRISARFTCHLTATAIAWRKDDGAFTLGERASLS